MNEEIFDELLKCDKSLDLIKREINLKTKIILYYITSLIDNLQFLIVY